MCYLLMLCYVSVFFVLAKRLLYLQAMFLFVYIRSIVILTKFCPTVEAVFITLLHTV